MIKTDCIHFQLDKPCVFHKTRGVKCSGCSNYAKVSASKNKKTKILIVKLDAMGDVMRSTFLIPGLKKKYKNSEITWIVAPESIQILEGNPDIDRIWQNNKNIFRNILSEKFDIVINLDLSPLSMSLATLAMADKKIGFTLDKNRQVICSNEYAKKWLLMSAFDDLKKANKHTYQYHMSKIAGLDRADYPIYVPLSVNSVAKAEAFAKKHGLKGKKVAAINPGAGSRWKQKKWTDSGYNTIINKLIKEGYKVLLFGGPQEEALIKKLVKSSSNKAISAGVNNSLNDFFALMNLADIVITGDTLALHVAAGLNKNIAAIFGPTSFNEIELYNLGIKVVSPIECKCCYKTDCTKKPDCMDLINTSTVWSAIKELI